MTQSQEVIMKKLVYSTVVAVAVVFGITSFVQAAGNAEDAKALAIAAANYITKHGTVKGFKDINDPKGPGVKGDLYVSVTDFNGVPRAYPTFPQLVGKDLLNIKDADGKPFIKESIELAKTKRSGWIQYRWTNPETKKVQLKKTWVQKVEGHDLFVLCGVFQ